MNPVQHLLAAGGELAKLPAASRQVLTGREFFPVVAVPLGAQRDGLSCAGWCLRVPRRARD